MSEHGDVIAAIFKDVVGACPPVHISEHLVASALGRDGPDLLWRILHDDPDLPPNLKAINGVFYALWITKNALAEATEKVPELTNRFPDLVVIAEAIENLNNFIREPYKPPKKSSFEEQDSILLDKIQITLRVMGCGGARNTTNATNPALIIAAQILKQVRGRKVTPEALATAMNRLRRARRRRDCQESSG